VPAWPGAVAPPGVDQAESPQVLVDHHNGHAARLHRPGDLADVGVVEQARRRPGPGAQVDALGDGELPDVNLFAVAVGVLGDELHVQNVHHTLVGQRKQLLEARGGEVAARKLDR